MPRIRQEIIEAMNSLIIVFVVVVFGGIGLSQVITSCPKQCFCEEQFFPETQGYGVKVNCSGRRLKKFPRPLPHVTTTLLLQNNRISKLEGWHFSGMIYLRILHLEGNRIKKIATTSLGYLPSLQTLYLQNNRIEELAFGAFRNCSRLQTLNLAKNKLTTLQYAAFDGLNQLDALDLSANLIGSIEDGAFLGLHRLRSLSLSQNQITKIGAYLFADVYSLTSLYLFRNQISVIENGAFSRLLYLKVLSLFDNKISAILQKTIVGLENLEELYLQRNRISKIEPWSFSATKKLRLLYLYSNLLSVIPDNMFEDLRHLSVLHLGINTISYVADEAFRHLGRLNVLNLDANRLTLLNHKTFYGLSNLKDIHLYFNNISYVGKGTFDHFKGITRLLWDVPEAYRVSLKPSAAKTRGSGLHCDCNARWLKAWLLERKLDDITCATPAHLTGATVTKLRDSDFVCGTFKVAVYPKQILAILGQNVEIHCHANMGATYHWMLRGVKLEADQYRVPNPLGLLTVYGLAEEDLGEYVCVAQNEAGLGASYATVTNGVRPQFTVYPSAVDATEPLKPVVLKCRAKGTPTPEINWYKDGLLIKGSPEESGFQVTLEGSLVLVGKRFHITREGSLIIFDPRMEDEGKYTCAAENKLGKISYDVSLYVETNSKCARGCRGGGICTAVKYDCICTQGSHKEGDKCVQDKKVKNEKTIETGSGSGSGPDGESGSGEAESEVGSGSGDVSPTKPTSHKTDGPGIDQETGSGSGEGERPSSASKGAGVDQEESGDLTSSTPSTEAGSGSGDGNAGGESEDGSLETWIPVEERSRSSEAKPMNPLRAPPL